MENFIVDAVHSNDSYIVRAKSLQSAINKVIKMGRSLIANNKCTDIITYYILDEIEEKPLRTIMLYKSGRKIVECIF